MGLTLAFKQRYGDEALKISRRFAENMGIKMGNKIKEMSGITGTDIMDIEQVYHAWLDPVLAPHKLETKIEENKLNIIRESPTKCPGIIVAKQMNLPLETVCHNISQPMFKGIAKAVNPNVEYNTVHMSEKKCIETIEIYDYPLF
jgi:hypothetical protein